MAAPESAAQNMMEEKCLSSHYSFIQKKAYIDQLDLTSTTVSFQTHPESSEAVPFAAMLASPSEVERLIEISQQDSIVDVMDAIGPGQHDHTANSQNMISQMSFQHPHIHHLHMLQRPESLTQSLKEPLWNVQISNKIKDLLEKEDTASGSHKFKAPMRDSKKKVTAFAVYHKTGTKFSVEALNVLHAATASQECKGNGCMKFAFLRNNSHVIFDGLGKSLQWNLGKLAYDRPVSTRFSLHAHKPFDIEPLKLLLVAKPSKQWEPPDGTLIVHWVRDPLRLIASAYRFLSKGSEKWQMRTRLCNYCHRGALEMLDDTCADASERRHCSYYNVINSLNDTEGSLYVTLMLQRQLQDMAGNIERWVKLKDDVLHLSVEMLSHDFDGTINCLMQFLNIDARLRTKVLLAMQTFDVNRHKGHHAQHVTSGKFDNSEIIGFLQTLPVWGQQFQEMSVAMQVIHRRQERQYGCPQVPA